MRTIPFRLKAVARPRESALRGAVRDFAPLAAFVVAGFGFGYFAFWRPLLAPLGY